MEILITGDYCPQQRAKDVLSNSHVLGGLQELIKNADLTITNLECPLTDSVEVIQKTGPCLKALPKQAEYLKQHGFDLVTLANNHIMDYRDQGLKDTIDALKANEIEFVGAGKADKEIDVIYRKKGDLHVAILNFCENEWSTQEKEGYKANGFSEIEAFYSIKRAKANADHVMVIHHGGHEMYNLPSPGLKKTLRYLVDCGANVVINHHTHCISGHERYRETPIFYSLGNFVFEIQSREILWNYGMLVRLILKKK